MRIQFDGSIAILKSFVEISHFGVSPSEVAQRINERRIKFNRPLIALDTSVRVAEVTIRDAQIIPGGRISRVKRDCFSVVLNRLVDVAEVVVNRAEPRPRIWIFGVNLNRLVESFDGFVVFVFVVKCRALFGVLQRGKLLLVAFNLLVQAAAFGFVGVREFLLEAFVFFVNSPVLLFQFTDSACRVVNLSAAVLIDVVQNIFLLDGNGDVANVFNRFADDHGTNLRVYNFQDVCGNCADFVAGQLSVSHFGKTFYQDASSFAGSAQGIFPRPFFCHGLIFFGAVAHDVFSVSLDNFGEHGRRLKTEDERCAQKRGDKFFLQLHGTNPLRR